MVTWLIIKLFEAPQSRRPRLPDRELRSLRIPAPARGLLGAALCVALPAAGHASETVIRPTMILDTSTGQYYVDGAGDVNGDGHGDLIASAWDGGDVYLGSAAGISSTPSVSFEGPLGGAPLVKGVGDVNGDGLMDVALGGTGICGESGCRGEVHVRLGSPSGVSSTPIVLLGTQAAGWFGTSSGGGLAPAGDVNADGYDDLLVGENQHTSAAGEASGAVYLFYGGPDGLSWTRRTAFYGTYEWEGLGQQIAGPGDLNGDGFDDIALWSGAGQLQVHHGSSAGASSVVAFTLDLLYAPGATGADINGDGYDDLIVGYDGVTALLGGPDSLSTERVLYLTGDANSDYLGWMIEAVGDVTGDGIDDVLVQSSYDGTDLWVGEVELYAGGSDGWSVEPVVTMTGAPEPHYFGLDMGASDLNGDGQNDLIVTHEVITYDGYNYYVHPELYVYDRFTQTDEDGDGVVAPLDCDDSDRLVGGATLRVYRDGDGDQFGGDYGYQLVCTDTEGWVTEGGDCADYDASINPDAQDLPGDGIDSNCDGADGGSHSCSTGGAAGSLQVLVLAWVFLPFLRRRSAPRGGIQHSQDRR